MDQTSSPSAFKSRPTDKFLQVLNLGTANDGRGDKLLRETPSHGDLRHTDTLFLGEFLDALVDGLTGRIWLVRLAAFVVARSFRLNPADKQPTHESVLTRSVSSAFHGRDRKPLLSGDQGMHPMPIIWRCEWLQRQSRRSPTFNVGIISRSSSR